MRSLLPSASMMTWPCSQLVNNQLGRSMTCKVSADWLIRCANQNSGKVCMTTSSMILARSVNLRAMGAGIPRDQAVYKILQKARAWKIKPCFMLALSPKWVNHCKELIEKHVLCHTSFPTQWPLHNRYGSCLCSRSCHSYATRAGTLDSRLCPGSHCGELYYQLSFKILCTGKRLCSRSDTRTQRESYDMGQGLEQNPRPKLHRGKSNIVP